MPVDGTSTDTTTFVLLDAYGAEAMEQFTTRYLAMAEQVFLNSLDNLEQLAFGLQSVAAVDMESINERLRTTADEEHERAPLLARAQLWHDQHKRADELLLENEHAMTQLDRVSARLAEIAAANPAKDLEKNFRGLLASAFTACTSVA